MDEEVFPIIDVSSLEEAFEEKTREIVEACKTWGFMILTGHGIPISSIDRMFELVSCVHVSWPKCNTDRYSNDQA